MTEDEAPKRANSSEIKPTVDAEEQVRTSPSAELPLCVPLDPFKPGKQRVELHIKFGEALLHC